MGVEDTLQRLQVLRAKLDDLKSDRAKYIKSSEVDIIVSNLKDEVAGIPSIHSDIFYPADKDHKGQIDCALDEIYILVSLFFMTIGRNKEAPALYALCTTILILMHHLIESGVYSNSDLNPIEVKLAEIKEAADRPRESYPVQMIEVLSARTSEGQKLLEVLRQRLSSLPKPLENLYDKLVSIRRQITAAASRPKFVSAELRELQDKLDEIETSRKDGAFEGVDGSTDGDQSLVKDLFEQCKEIAKTFAAQDVKVHSALKGIYTELGSVKGQLEKQALTHTWSLRETDLFDMLQILRRVDSERVDGKFVGSDKSTPVEGQKVLLYMLRKSYALTYQLLSSSEPISEALQPVHNQLSTLKTCLLEVKKSGGISSARELFPFSIKLASIENMRKEGKFYVGSEIPEGQGSVNDLLAECFEVLYDLRSKVESDRE